MCGGDATFLSITFDLLLFLVTSFLMHFLFLVDFKVQTSLLLV